jgi:hypothetical protein
MEQKMSNHRMYFDVQPLDMTLSTLILLSYDEIMNISTISEKLSNICKSDKLWAEKANIDFGLPKNVFSSTLNYLGTNKPSDKYLSAKNLYIQPVLYFNVAIEYDDPDLMHYLYCHMVSIQESHVKDANYDKLISLVNNDIARVTRIRDCADKNAQRVFKYLIDIESDSFVLYHALGDVSSFPPTDYVMNELVDNILEDESVDTHYGFCCAVMLNNVKVIKRLLLVPTVTPDHIESAIEDAVTIAGSIEILDILLAHCSNEEKQLQLNKALIETSRHNLLEITKHLIGNGANNIQEALWCAQENNSNSIVKYLEPLLLT